MTEEKEEKIDIKKVIEENNKLLKELKKVPGVKEGKVKKIGKSQQKRGYVNYWYIHENNEVEVLKVPVDEMTTFIDKTPRIATPEHLLTYKGTPTIIQHAGSTEPFSPRRHLEEAAQNNMLAAGWRLLINRAESGDIKSKKKLSGTALFFIIVAVLVVGYLLLA